MMIYDESGFNSTWAAERLMESLAEAFGGASQVPDKIVGMAIAGQCYNGRLMYKDKETRKQFLADVIYYIRHRWEDNDLTKEDLEYLKSSIAKGIKAKCKNLVPEGKEIVNHLLS